MDARAVVETVKAFVWAIVAGSRIARERFEFRKLSLWIFGERGEECSSVGI
jgi:hypothetical protein